MDARDRTRGLAAPAVGLVSPLPPQVGGVASVAEWLLEHQDEIGCRYVTFDLWRPVEDEMGGTLRWSSIGRQLRLLPRFVRWVARAPRIVHVCVSCSPTGLMRDLVYVAILRATRRKTIVHVHGSQLDLTPQSAIRAWPLRLIGRLTEERIAVAPWAVSVLGEVGVSARCILNPIRVEPNGDRRAPRSSPQLRLLFVGTYGARKGCPELVEAVARARRDGVDVTLRFVGKEERRGEEQALRRQVAEAGLESVVEFAGLMGADALRRCYLEADVICLPSQREVLPMALLEGMAFGLPVLATRVGGIPDVVEHGATGLLVSPGKPDELAGAIAELASDPDRVSAMGAAARSSVLAAAGRDAIVARWRSLYAEYASAASA
jgi:glycosyltransferase involved in cell wall biosynthesis